MNRVNVRCLAAMLLQVIRLLSLDVLRVVTLAEIDQAAELWANDTDHHFYRKAGKHSKHVFTTAARLFLRFHGMLTIPLKQQPFQVELSQFLKTLGEERGLAVPTVEAHRGHLGRFLIWISVRHTHLPDIRATDVLDYLDLKRRTCSGPSVCTAAHPLRSFFAYGETLGWCTPHLRSVLTFPNRRRFDPATIIPTWDAVRQLLDDDRGERTSDYRTRAMLLLCSIYGLRASEVARLRLSDIDWADETLTVTRSKNGRTQQYPLQLEVAQGILRYLKNRPHCSSRNVFVTLQRPFRPIRPASLSLIARRRMLQVGIKSSKMGPHALRHACATQLLRTGSSLRQIADFLGHRDLTTVSVYAKCDIEALREVAAFRLRGVL